VPNKQKLIFTAGKRRDSLDEQILYCQALNQEILGIINTNQILKGSQSSRNINGQCVQST
jgi:hypothetical protein